MSAHGSRTAFERIIRRQLRASGVERQVKEAIGGLRRLFDKAVNYEKMIDVIMPILSEHFSDEQAKRLSEPSGTLSPSERRARERVLCLLRQAMQGYTQRVVRSIREL